MVADADEAPQIVTAATQAFFFYQYFIKGIYNMNVFLVIVHMKYAYT